MKAALREKSTEGFSDMSFDELIMVNGGSDMVAAGSPYYLYPQGDGMPLYSGAPSQPWTNGQIYSFVKEAASILWAIGKNL